jgi:hypothetical protein
MKVSFTDRQRTLIHSLRARDAGANAIAFDNLEKGELNFSDIEVLCDIINSEFMTEGILPNFEPNKYGLELEGLLDVLNRPRLKSNPPP